MLRLRKALMISAIILLVATIGTAIWAVHASTLSPLPFEEGADYVVLQYHALEIAKPLHYWALTDPDEYVLDAIAHAHDPPTTAVWDGQNVSFCYLVYVRANETTFVYQVYAHGQVWDVEYEGHYYALDATYYYDLGGLPRYYRLHKEDPTEETITASSILGASWLCLGIVWLRKKPEPTS